MKCIKPHPILIILPENIDGAKPVIVIILSAAFVPIMCDEHRQTDKHTSCSLVSRGLRPYKNGTKLIVNIYYIIIIVVIFSDI